MKRIKGWGDWQVHPFTLVYLLISCLTNNFIYYSSALLIVCFHEYWHYYFAKKFNFSIEKVEVFPFGAFLSLNDFGMHHVVAELIVVLAGLCSHFFIGIGLYLFLDYDYLWKINRLVFLFNLLPIYPMDGAKIFLLILSFFKDYQKAIKWQIKLSIFCLGLVMVYYHEISYWLIFAYLLYLNYRYIKEYRVAIIALYLNRNVQYQRIKLNHDWRFYRPYHNIYLFNNQTYDESEVLKYLVKRLEKS